jgi:site-specific recombinase XerC
LKPVAWASVLTPDRPFDALQGLMGHSRPDTTQAYTDEVDLDELAEA